MPEGGRCRVQKGGHVLCFLSRVLGEKVRAKEGERDSTGL
jgi:hypothetical protein